MRAACVFLLLTPILAPAQQEQSVNPTFRVGNGVSAPTLVSKVQPSYSEEARHARLQGTVLLFIVVNADGMAENMRVIQGLGLGLDENAMAAVRNWQFRPGVKEGKPVNVAATVEVNFVPTSPSQVAALGWTLRKISFQLPNMVSRPTITKVKYPKNSKQSGSVTLSFQIDENGGPTNIRIEKSSDFVSGSELMNAVENWRFQPGLQDGKPIAVPCTLEFAQGDAALTPGR